MVIANSSGTQIGITFTGDNNNNNVKGDKVIGTVYKDILRGSNGGDQLVGLSGNDELYGGNGGDIIWGGKGVDRIDLGGGSKDIVVFNKSDVGTGADTVLQFSKNQDVIGLAGGLTYGTGNSATDVYLSGNALKVGSTTLATLEGFSGSLSASNFQVKTSAQGFFDVVIPSQFI
jgi:Ca2+-binding RTX toxin-like protein